LKETRGNLSVHEAGETWNKLAFNRHRIYPNKSFW